MNDNRKCDERKQRVRAAVKTVRGQLNQKMLILIPVFILVAFSSYFNFVFTAHEDAMIREKAYEKQQDIDMLCALTDRLVELGTEGDGMLVYKDVLVFAAQHIDREFYNTFAQVFDAELTPLIRTNPGVGGGRKHNPLDYDEFVDAVTANDAGVLEYTYTTAEAGKRTIYMAYRWAPSGADPSQKYLIAIGVSKYTIREQINEMAIYGAIALIIVTSVIIFGCAVVMIRLLPEGKKRNGGDE